MFQLGGGPADKMLHFQKLCLKSIFGHSESFWKKKFQVKKGGGPILSHFSPIFGFQKFLQVFDIS